ncbi:MULTISPECIES: hypothetical protein [Pseudomonadaceae]|uniref:Tetratricopeptide repeat protein n=1 Tax=Pseudomonas saudiphocaensis TaxID=1499686 RepID=A0A078LNI1_9PSED|nr:MULTISPECIES: hypothetical protein [Pseudomonadaceae]MCF6783079.1 hypothetical protein [Stutzerimonas stutzeri]MCF6806027.1 hypothetical protein [Stutzerimonas stutzeri]CDZ94053.1 hypothetical protein BN1079_01364 [Pseudomonas saudiphocaensis]
MRFTRFTFFFIAVLSLTGCVSAIQTKNVRNYTLMGMQAQAVGNWDLARRAYARAVVNAELAKLPPAVRSVLTYEYGRALGVTCFFELSESELNLAYKLDKEAGNPLYLSLVELARLSLDQNKYHEAVGYFAKAIVEFDKEDFAANAPIGYADVLAEYAASLSAIDKKSEASSIMHKAAEIRAANPQGRSITDRTPYGKFCTA